MPLPSYKKGQKQNVCKNLKNMFDIVVDVVEIVDHSYPDYAEWI